ATAPLLGLLGTVTGIIKTFKLMEIFGAGDPKPLISGISEALITTEMGLILAIPALIAHALLSRRVAGILAQM
ncbi:MAG TPA: flagellar motor protein MotA, partial [Verrucomicrobiales bacterium]|nr:flagellar motor protein MotA [Verrucomicrobiales bacterium]